MKSKGPPTLPEKSNQTTTGLSRSRAIFSPQGERRNLKSWAGSKERKDTSRSFSEGSRGTRSSRTSKDGAGSRSKSQISTRTEQGKRWAECNQKPIGLENAERLVRLFGLRIGQIRANQVESPECIGVILQRLIKKWRESHEKQD